MELFAAIDLRDGRCVRLHQGDYDRETVYDDDPVAQAKAFADAGADWVHVVDLDGARSGVPQNHDVVSAIAEAVPVPVQTGGGIRTAEAARALVDAGVERVVIGTSAVSDPELVGALVGDMRVAVGLDARVGEVATDGWLAGSGRTVLDVADSFANTGVDAFVVTDIARDGTLVGPDLAGLAEILAATETDVIASGGVGSLDDLMSLAGLDADGRTLAGVIVGKAIYEGRVDLGDAVTTLSRTAR